MKKISITAFLLVMTIGIISCSEDKPTKEESFLSELSGTWQVDAVSLDGEDVTEEFDGMLIEFKKNKTFTVQNPVGNIWNASGTFDPQETSGDLFDLLRGDGTLIIIDALDASTLVLSMQFDSAPGKIRGLAGEYVFEMKR